MRKSTGRNALVALLTAVIVIATVAASARGGRPRRRARKPHLKIGQEAPDFDLPLLNEGKNDEGNSTYTITDTTVKLSSFEGEKIVCVFFSSYT